MPIFDPYFVTIAVIAVLIVGLSKAGLLGSLGMVGVPLLSLVMPARDAAGMMLPVLLAMDVIAVWTYRKEIDWRIIRIMLPGAAVGTLLGWALWSVVSDDGVLLFVGVVTLLFILDAILPLRKKLEAMGHVLGRLCWLHQLHQPYWRSAVPDLRATAAPAAAGLFGHHLGVLCHRQHGEAGPLLLPGATQPAQSDSVGVADTGRPGWCAGRRLAGAAHLDGLVLPYRLLAGVPAVALHHLEGRHGPVGRRVRQQKRAAASAVTLHSPRG
jgi:hypothetical protein